MSGLNVALLCGGRSPEHDVSLMSAEGILEILREAGHAVTVIFIDQEACWWLCPSGTRPTGHVVKAERVTLLGGGRGEALVFNSSTAAARIEKFDVVFPVLHGPFGEDGTVQGLLEYSRVPYVGSGVAGSAICMDKHLTKELLRRADLPVAKSHLCRRGASVDLRRIEQEVGAGPLFVKPASLGSSIGVRKVGSISDLPAALELAWTHDSKVLVEESVIGREIECAVLETDEHPSGLFVSAPGEIIPALDRHEFYTYEAKYLDPQGAALEPVAEVSDTTRALLQDMARSAFRALECRSLARVDFFLPDDGRRVVINEVNTMPGFTRFSMYPKMMDASGVSYRDLVAKLLHNALS